MERPSEQVHLVRIGPTGRRPALLLAAACIALTVALAKPWGDASRRPDPAHAPAGAPAGAAHAPPEAASGAGSSPGAAPAAGPGRPAGPSPARSLPDVPLDAPAAATVNADGLPVCFTPDGWRLIADEAIGGRTARSWIPVAVVAAGPGQTALPTTRVVSAQVTGLGFCVPAALRDTGPWRATLWAVGGTTDLSRETTLAPLARLTAPDAAGGAITAEPGGGTPSPGASARRAGWPPGRYVMEVQGPARGAPRIAFAIDLVAPAPGGVSAAAAP